MDSLNKKMIYEVMFKVKPERCSEFEKHCRDTSNLLDGAKGFQSASFSKRLSDDHDLNHYRVEMIFDSQDAINNYQQNIVPKVRSQGPDFGEDARVEERRTYHIFHNK
jgi:heme-degrading monooxygenase HmoA